MRRSEEEMPFAEVLALGMQQKKNSEKGFSPTVGGSDGN